MVLGDRGRFSVSFRQKTDEATELAELSCLAVHNRKEEQYEKTMDHKNCSFDVRNDNGGIYAGILWEKRAAERAGTGTGCSGSSRAGGAGRIHKKQKEVPDDFD